jgi:hypothetical protein
MFSQATHGKPQCLHNRRNSILRRKPKDDDSDSHDGDRPRVQLGEDIALDDDDVESDGGESTDTEAELEKKAGGEVALNL